MSNGKWPTTVGAWTRSASVAVFEQHPIGVEVDSVPSFYLTSVFNGMLAAKTHHYPGVPQAFAAMKAGEVDAVMAMRGEIDWQVHEAADPQLALAENAYPNMGKQPGKSAWPCTKATGSWPMPWRRRWKA
jgi:ABC-type amino acid transport substrate-binding protein